MTDGPHPVGDPVKAFRQTLARARRAEWVTVPLPSSIVHDAPFARVVLRFAVLNAAGLHWSPCRFCAPFWARRFLISARSSRARFSARLARFKTLR